MKTVCRVRVVQFRPVAWNWRCVVCNSQLNPRYGSTDRCVECRDWKRCKLCRDYCSPDDRTTCPYCREYRPLGSCPHVLLGKFRGDTAAYEQHLAALADRAERELPLFD